MKSLKEISNDSFYKMQDYHQISIDFIQETEELFDEKPFSEKDNLDLICLLGSLSYQINIALEVFNPEYETEISDLKHILSLIEIRTGYLESLDFKK